MVFSLTLWHLGLADPGGRAPPKASKILGGSKLFAQQRAFQMQRYHSRAHAPNHLLQHAVTLGVTPCLPQSSQCQVSNSQGPAAPRLCSSLILFSLAHCEPVYPVSPLFLKKPQGSLLSTVPCPLCQSRFRAPSHTPHVRTCLLLCNLNSKLSFQRQSPSGLGPSQPK